MNLTISVDKKFVELIDSAIDESKMYSSRSEFLKDAVREKVEKQKQFNNTIKIKDEAKKLGEKALQKGWNGELISKEEKNRAMKELLIEKGINPDGLVP